MNTTIEKTKGMCRCGHPGTYHDGLIGHGKCLMGECGCGQYTFTNRVEDECEAGTCTHSWCMAKRSAEDT